MIVGVPRESYPGERRVALVPAVVPSLAKGGFEVAVEGVGREADHLQGVGITGLGGVTPGNEPVAGHHPAERDTQCSTGDAHRGLLFVGRP